MDSYGLIALSYGLDDRGSRVRFPVGAANFSLNHRVHNGALGPNKSPIQWVPGSLSMGVKRPGREADRSLPSSVEVKLPGAILPLTQYTFMAWCSGKSRGTTLPVPYHLN